MTSGQSLALFQLREIADVDGHSLEIENVKEPSGSDVLWITINIHVGAIKSVEGGLPLRDRETFILKIPPGFPLQKPDVLVKHDRFAGKPHVQWVFQLCLYQSATEWNPSDGMFGLIERLQYWLKQGALDQLDPEGEPLHPPAVYADVQHGKLIIPRVDTPSFDGSFWLGLAQIRDHPNYIEINSWRSPNEQIPSDAGVALAVLFAAPLPWEYPTTGAGLFREFARQGISEGNLFRLLKISAILSPMNRPMYVILGSPMRGIGSGQRKQHLSAWAIESDTAGWIRNTIQNTDDSASLQELREKLAELTTKYLESAKVSWCPVIEDRPEIITRRDHNSVLSYFRGKAVSIWGCGALGGNIAIYLVRAGIRRIVLRDKGIVTPGILVRQPYTTSDIGNLKVDALKRDLLTIRSDLDVSVHSKDLEEEFLSAEFHWTDNSDVVIDATASDSVRRHLEVIWNQKQRIHVAALMIDQTAKRLITAIVDKQYSGATWQVWRNTKIKILPQERFAPFADSFFPAKNTAKPFQPEPGCSEPTFVGSSADSAGLAAIGLNLIAKELSAMRPETAISHLFAQPAGVATEGNPTGTSGRLEFSSDFLLRLDDQEVRISQAALGEMKGWISQNRRLRRHTTETGGLLWGEWDDSTGIVWVTDASGPPPDSHHSEKLFVCGVEGTREEHNRRALLSRRSIGYIGMWHTHPVSEPFPSRVDLKGMHSILTSGTIPPRKNLLIIIGREGGKDILGAYLFRRLAGDEKSAVHQLKQARKQLSEYFL